MRCIKVIFTNLLSTSKITHLVSITKTNLLIALSEESVFGETDTKPVNIFTLCLQNADIFSIVPDDR